jgi:predicted phage terminase large subunit-like protein
VKPKPKGAKALLAEKAWRFDQMRRELARRSFKQFCIHAWNEIPGEQSTPLIWNWHMDIFCKELEALVRGKSKKRNLVINVPPGSGKSSFVSILLPAWVWLWKPEWTSLFVSGADDVSIRDSMKCRGLITSDWYKGFGNAWKLAPDQDAKGWFKNTKGGERQATTIGSRGTGKRVDAVFFDDPNDTKDNSDTKLQAVSDAYRLTFQNRQKDMTKGIRCLIQQRTHLKDLTGWILGTDPDAWARICIRQEFEANDPDKHPDDPRTEAGELFFEARNPRDVVDSEKRNLGTVGYAGQHQQRPIPQEGGLFKPAKIIIEELAPANLTECRGWDAGASEGKGDFTVGAKLGRATDGAYWILDIARKQTGEPRAMAKQQAQLDGQATVISWPQDPGQAGKDQAQSMVKDFAGWIFKTSPETGAKRTRWEPLASQVNGGNVRMVRAMWNRALIEEMETDGQVHDDQLDALARAFTEISRDGDAMDAFLSGKARA